MKLFALALGAAALPLAASHPMSGDWCGTTDASTSHSFLKSVADLHALESGSLPADTSLSLSGGTIKLLRARDAQQVGGSAIANLTIPFYLHIVASEGKTDVLTDAVIASQLRVMEQSFAPYNIAFDIRTIQRYVDNELARSPFDSGSSRSVFDSFFRRTRQGGYDTLNTYFYTDFPARVFGACTLPERGLNNAGLDDIFRDLCQINSGTVPGGEIAYANLGYTLVHEVGHWLGLLHTFSGFGCTGPGDFVDDTPAQSSPTRDCPVGKDSCRNQPGLDAIQNYMDYSSDSCYTEFSAGQAVRMLNSYNVFRRPT